MSTRHNVITGATGHTYTEAWRFECEARWLAALPKPQRDRYLHGDGAAMRPLTAIRGQPAVDRLIAAARQYHAERRKTPTPQQGETGAAMPRSVHQATDTAQQPLPACGSSLAIPTGGDSTPGETVVSEGGAR